MGTLALWDAADAKGLENHGVIVGPQRVEDPRPQARGETYHNHVLIQALVDARPPIRPHHRRARPGDGHSLSTLADDAVAADDGRQRVVYAGKRIEAHGALLVGARSHNDRAAKHDGHVMRVVVGGVEQRLVQVELGVGEGVRHGLLRAREHDGLGTALDEIGEGSRRVCHGVRAVEHHKAVVVVVGVHDCGGNALPVAGAHVGRVDVHGLNNVQVTHATRLRNIASQLLARKCGSKARAVCLRHGCNGATRGHHEDPLHVLLRSRSTPLPRSDGDRPPGGGPQPGAYASGLTRIGMLSSLSAVAAGR